MLISTKTNNDLNRNIFAQMRNRTNAIQLKIKTIKIFNSMKLTEIQSEQLYCQNQNQQKLRM